MGHKIPGTGRILEGSKRLGHALLVRHVGLIFLKWEHQILFLVLYQKVYTLYSSNFT